MKQTDDNSLRKQLASVKKEAPENPWFTRKVMNRLPEKERKSYGWILWTIYSFVLAVCLACWFYFGKHADFNRMFEHFAKTGTADSSLLAYLALLGITGIAVWQMASNVLNEKR